MRVVELASLAILALAVALRRERAKFLLDAAALGAAAWIAEDLCIRLFGFYAYAPGWSLRLDRVPVMVAAIWPFVILSARDLARTPLAAGALICFDAALVEPVAVRAGLWTWIEPGLFGVPLIGVAGWGVFGAISLALLGTGRRLLVVIAAPLLANVALVALWWGAFRWGPRSELPAAAAIALACAAAALLVARSRRALAPLDAMLPRGAAALLFFSLAGVHGGPALWIFCAPFAAPYLWMTGLDPARRRA